jgi:hypothetical protein
MGRVKLRFNFTRVFKVSQIARVANSNHRGQNLFASIRGASGIARTRAKTHKKQMFNKCIFTQQTLFRLTHLKLF